MSTPVPPIGTIIDLNEMKGRWLYSEIDPSGRWCSDRRAEFAGKGLDQVLARADEGASYDELTEAEKALIDGRYSVDVGGLIGALGRFWAFRLEAWSADRLKAALTVPALDPLRLGRLISLEELARQPTPAEKNHPVTSAEARVGKLIEAWPVAVPHLVGGSFKWVLLDGTSRSLGFTKAASALDTLPVWTAPAPTVISMGVPA